jgi:hypothetical protein
MAGTVGEDSLDEAPSLWVAYLFILGLTDHSETWTTAILQTFFSHGPRDREGRDRYTAYTTETKLPEGQLRSHGRPIYNERDPQFWYSDSERGISCVYDFRNSSIHWSSPMVYPKAPSDEDKEDEEITSSASDSAVKPCWIFCGAPGGCH